MCYLVTIGTRSSESAVQALAADHGLVARRSTNRATRAIFPRDLRLFELSTGQCACDMVSQGTEAPSDEYVQRLRAAYEQKGWSQAKVARALREWELAGARRRERQATPKRLFSAFLRTAASRGPLRVFIHFYSGDFDTEVVSARAGVKLAADDLVDPAMLATDTLVEVIPSRLKAAEAEPRRPRRRV